MVESKADFIMEVTNKTRADIQVQIIYLKHIFNQY